ncbi:MAG: ABC-F family ATP-binding cassette domain-containing protein [Thermoleophilia bacterium]
MAARWGILFSMLHIIDLEKSFGAQVVLEGASLHIKPGMRVGLVGPNGAGKTTLLRIIAGDLSPDAGDINARKGLRIGFLPQEIESLSGSTPLEEVLASYSSILAMEKRMHELGEKMASQGPQAEEGRPPGRGSSDELVAADPGTAEDSGSLLLELGRLQTAFENAGGYELEARAAAILRGMGFGDADFERPVEELSGGWRMRVALARLLMEQPDLLLLDEPTNHLDLESLLWLEEFLLAWPGSLVLISHDRYFLNRLVTHIVELDRGSLDLYTGDYDRFEREKRQRFETLRNAARNQQREIDQAESFIRRFRAKNTKARQVQQKIKQLERLEKVEVPELGRKEIRFRFPQPGRIGRVVAELEHVRKSYGSKVVYEDLGLVVERGEKIALVGPNGAGKSTLLKLLAGTVQADEGRVRFGHRVRREYFAQHQLEVFDPDKTVLRTMEEAAGPVDRADQVRDFLGAFLFSGDEVDKPVGVLSGGEKSRLALARMLLDPAGLLLLDEPTNHLDMASREVLTEALRQFEGSIVFISHDRHLINAIATKVVEVRNGRLTHYPGDWEYYNWKKRKEEDPVASEAVGSARGSAGAAARGAASDLHAGGQTLTREERKDIQRRHRKVERRILELEERQEELAAVLNDPGHASDYQVLAEASEEAARIREMLAELYPEWEKLAELEAGFSGN